MSVFVAKWYTRASRVRIVIAKFDGRWTIPGGPYPIPELVALVGGLLATLMLLPRIGHPIATLVVGAGSTALGVAVMRRMPYSPVPFGTRVHRVMRLYTHPDSASSGRDDRTAGVMSVVRPTVAVLDIIADAAPPGCATSAPAAPRGWDELFESATVADLFG